MLTVAWYANSFEEFWAVFGKLLSEKGKISASHALAPPPPLGATFASLGSSRSLTGSSIRYVKKKNTHTHTQNSSSPLPLNLSHSSSILRLFLLLPCSNKQTNKQCPHGDAVLAALVANIRYSDRFSASL